LFGEKVMQSNSNVNFKENMTTLISFSVNNPEASIKADTAGKLFVSSDSYYSWGVGYLTGTKLEGTVSVIDNTCVEILKEISSTLEKAAKTDSLEVSLEAREIFLQAEQVLTGLKNIYGVYSKRYEGAGREGVENLAKTIDSFEKGIKSFEDQESSLMQRIEFASAKIFKEAENNLEDTFDNFVHIPDEVEPKKVFAGLEAKVQNLPQESNWWSTHGEGPTMLGKMASGITTAKELFVGTIAPYAFTPSSDPVALSGQKRVANSGRQLGGADVNNYIQGLQKEMSLNTIRDFYLGAGQSINKNTLADIKEIIDLQVEQFQKFDVPAPVIIPIVFSGDGGIWERNHISVILIKITALNTTIVKVLRVSINNLQAMVRLCTMCLSIAKKNLRMVLSRFKKIHMFINLIPIIVAFVSAFTYMKGYLRGFLWVLCKKTLRRFQKLRILE